MARHPTVPLTVEQAAGLGVRDVEQLWARHVNPALLNNYRLLGTHRLDIVRAQGSTLELANGRQILDFSSSLGVTSVGHAHPAVLAAQQRFRELQQPDAMKLGPTRWQAALAHNLAALLPEPLDTCFFTTSGAEAVEAGLKLAFKLGGSTRTDVICAGGAFHGKTLGALAVTTAGRFRSGFLLGIPPEHVFEVPFNDAAALTSRLQERVRASDGRSSVAAVLVEPVQGQGLRVADREYLSAVVRSAREFGAVSIFDEVKTGCGRVGSFVAFDGCGAVPDVVTLAKGLGGGKHALGAMVTSAALFARAYGKRRDAALHTTTFGGLGEACAVGIAVTQLFARPEFVARVRAASTKLDEALNALARSQPHRITELVGRGLLRGIRVSWPGAESRRPGLLSERWFGTYETACMAALVRELLGRHDVLTHFCDSDPDVLHVMPPLVVQDAEIERFARAVDSALSVPAWRRLARLALGR